MNNVKFFKIIKIKTNNYENFRKTTGCKKAFIEPT